jgi:hypothetical protein
MSSSSTDIVRNLILTTLNGDKIEVEGTQIEIADTAKAYFDTPFDEDVHISPLSTSNMLLMVHIPFHTQIQTYVKIKKIMHTNTFVIYHRILDLQGRVYSQNMYLIRKIGKQAYEFMNSCKLVWLNEEEAEISPVMSSFSSLANYMACHLERDPNTTLRAFELAKEFITQRLEVDWNRTHLNQELLRMRLIRASPWLAPSLTHIDPKIPVFRYLPPDEESNDASQCVIS